MSTPPTSWIGVGSSARTSQANSTAKSTSERGDEGRHLRPQHPDRRDTGDVGERRRDDRDDEHRHPPRHRRGPDDHGGRSTRRVEHPDERRGPQHDGADGEPGAGQGDRRQLLVDLGGDEEVEDEQHRSSQAPEDAGGAQPHAAHDVEDEHEASHGEDDPGDGEAAGACRCRSQSQPTMRTGREVLEQQRHPDGEVAHRVEVGELATRDPGEPVADDEARTATQHSPTAAQHPQGGHEQGQRSAGDAQGHHGARCPTPDEQRLGKGP